MNINKKIEQEAGFLTAPKIQMSKQAKRKSSELRVVKKVALPKRGEFNFLKTGKG